jgi:hypothetical protein
MNPDIRRIEDEFCTASQKAEGLQLKLKALRRDCRHKWSAVVYDPIVTPAYTDPGDPPGTMGVDFRGPCYVPKHERARWKRVCSECGDVEYTFDTQDRVEKIPVFRR